MEIIGQIIKICATCQISDKLKKREFIVAIDHMGRKEPVSFQITHGRCAVLDGFNVGDEVVVMFNLRGRQVPQLGSAPKYFNALECWRIEKIQK